MRSRTVANNSMRPNESHGPLRSVAVIGRISAARVPALSQPNQGLEAPRPGPSETFRSTERWGVPRAAQRNSCPVSRRGTALGHRCATAGAGAHAHTKVRATLLKARRGPQSTMARALEDLRLHQRAQREGVPRELLG